MTIVELREKRAKLWDTMEGFLDTHRDRKGVLSAEDDAVYANMEKELNDLTNEVRRMERRDAIAAELAKPVSSPITEQPQKATGEVKTGRASNAYREDFGLHLRGKRMLHNVLSEGVDANGGYGSAPAFLYHCLSNRHTVFYDNNVYSKPNSSCRRGQT